MSKAAPKAEDSDTTWDSHDNFEESDDDGFASIADEEYWEDDAVADTWLARNPGGTPFLYPQLYVVKPRIGEIATPSRNLTVACHLLRLPPELRDMIYDFYFEQHDEKRADEKYAPFKNIDGNILPRIYLSSENVELKFWLSSALLQTSRQVRYEAIT